MNSERTPIEQRANKEKIKIKAVEKRSKTKKLKPRESREKRGKINEFIRFTSQFNGRLSPEEITLAKAYELLVAHFGIIPAGKMAPELKAKYIKTERECAVIFDSKTTDKEICRVYVNNKGEAVLFRIAL